MVCQQRKVTAASESQTQQYDALLKAKAQLIWVQAGSLELVPTSYYRVTEAGFYSVQDRQLSLFKKDCFLIVYIDDCLIFAQEETVIDKLIQSLSTQFLLQDKGNVS